RGGLFEGSKPTPNPSPQICRGGGQSFIDPYQNKIFQGGLPPPVDPGALLQPDDLRPASGRFLERGDPAHAGPAAQIPGSTGRGLTSGQQAYTRPSVTSVLFYG